MINLNPIPGLRFRTIHEGDMDFLKKVYRSTRETELNLTSWNEQQKSNFISQQFEAQHQYYTENYTGAHFTLILVGEQRAGRLYAVEWPDEIRIIDLTLLPEFRGKGYGSQILRSILDHGATNRKKVGIHVERTNPAMKLYDRLGFLIQEDKGVYQFLEWIPASIHKKPEGNVKS